MLRRTFFTLTKSFSFRSKSKILLLSFIVASCLCFISLYKTSNYKSRRDESKEKSHENHRHFYRIKERTTITDSHTSSVAFSSNSIISLVTTHLLTRQNLNQTNNYNSNINNTIEWRHLTAYDGGGFGSTQTGTLLCSSSLSQIDIKSSRDAVLTANFSFFHMNAPKSSLFLNANNETSWVFIFILNYKDSFTPFKIEIKLNFQKIVFIFYFERVLL